MAFAAATVPLPSWITTWVLVATTLVSIDCVYLLSMKFGRPEYMPSVLAELWQWYGESDAQYSGDGVGMQEGNGWVETQSIFNVFEVIGMLIYLFALRRQSIAAALTILTVSVATFWKTAMYMCIIFNSNDPVKMVPLLACAGIAPRPENTVHVATLLAAENCETQFFKFQFNFWWLVMPLAVIWTSWTAIARALADRSTNVKAKAA
ncbi:Aste57867_22609 [Aphanomyces stellatus]|uniref:Aste57867_22609 protein n=1 Tax=Aphanomyces stellatus TaxID=120398 RepID=A0A485LMA0_9STRA|nr:hypothetical protein As57867_022539 [Aphanomyces stellatus]VFT99266.1 Aste57867_22609 [Aphanomyces stellatus]